MFSYAKFLILMVYRQLMVLSDITMLQKRECNCRNATAYQQGDLEKYESYSSVNYIRTDKQLCGCRERGN